MCLQIVNIFFEFFRGNFTRYPLQKFEIMI